MTEERENDDGTKFCVFPFYENKGSEDWIIGTIITRDYYTVYDLSNEDGSGDIHMKMGKKNPAYEKKPDVPGGDGGDDGPTPDGPKQTEVVVIILAVVIVIATLILLYVCIKRKQKNDQTFMFNKN